MAELKTQGLVKQRKRQELCASGDVYELLAKGVARAEALRTHGEGRDREPKRHHRRVGVDERGVVLVLVDLREGGGDSRAGFWDLCGALERADVRFESRSLPAGAGDYQALRRRVMAVEKSRR